VNVKNVGNGEDYIEFSAYSDWKPSISIENATLLPYSSIDVILTLKIPDSAKGQNQITFIATSSSNKSFVYNITTTVSCKCKIDIEAVGLKLRNFEEGKIPIKIKNLGDCKETVILSLKSDGLNLKTEFEDRVMEVEKNKTTILRIIPINASAGEYTVYIEAYIVSNSLKFRKQINLEVEKESKLRIYVSKKEAKISKGEKVFFFIKLKNEGNIKEKIRIETSKGSLNKKIVSLKEYEETELKLTYESNGKNEKIEINAKSEGGAYASEVIYVSSSAKIIPDFNIIMFIFVLLLILLIRKCTTSIRIQF
ncbi:MAG: hypothetical protein AB1779_12235, partial [Candidatus Thermoplasmatota archaeon]